MRNFFGILLFSIYALFARYHYVCKIKNHCNQEEYISVKYGTQSVLKDYQTFNFDVNNPTPFLSANNEAFLDNLATYLHRNQDKVLHIKAGFSPEEKLLSGSFYENLGLARAAMLRNLLVDQKVDEKRISLEYTKLNSPTKNYPTHFEIFDAPVDSLNTGQNSLQYSFYDMTFSDTDFSDAIFTPGEVFKFYADSVINHLKTHQDKVLRIVGHVDQGSESFNMELAAERVAAMRDYFLAAAVENEIIVEAKGNSEPFGARNNRLNIIID